MEQRPGALLLKFPGTNCDAETARALRLVGFDVSILPIAELAATSLSQCQLLVLAGGFSYGDYVMSGRFAELELKNKLGARLRQFVDGGGFVVGICNGFQILTRVGLLPEGSLIDNDSGRFQCQWAGLEKRGTSRILEGLPDHFELPIAHAEGRFVTRDPALAEQYVANGLACLTYREDTNGSAAAIAGLQDETGRVFGLMPHPERFVFKNQHYDPDWDADPHYGWGFYFFRSLFHAVTTHVSQSEPTA